MAYSYKLTDGTFSIELVYNVSSQPYYKEKYGSRFEVPEPFVTMHTPTNAPARPTWAYDPNRMVFLRMDIKGGGSWDTVQNKIADIRRMIDGAYGKAIRYWVNGEFGERVCLRVQHNGSTNYTDIPVIYGFVDDSQAMHSEPSLLNTFAYDIVVGLMCRPYGEGAVISLKNRLVNPAFDYLDAYNWTDINTPTKSFPTDEAKLPGKYCIKLVLDQNDGIYTGVEVSGTARDWTTYIWAYLSAGEATYYLDKHTTVGTGGTNLDSATVTSGNSDRSTVDSAGNTWYRIPLTGSTDATNDAAVIRIVATGASGATLYVTAAYLEDSASGSSPTVPSAWSGYYKLENRGDRDATNGDEFHYLQTWGVPGDADALITFKLDQSDTIKKVVVAQDVDDLYQAIDKVLWIGSDLLTAGSVSAAAWSTTVDATRTEGEYERLTSSGTGSGSTSYALTSKETFSRALRIYALCRSSSTAATLTFTSDQGTVYADTIGVDTIDQWEIVDLGDLNTENLFPDDAPNTSGTAPLVTLTFSVAALPNTKTFDIDGIYLMPSSFGFAVGLPDDAGSNLFWIVGEKGIIRDASGSYVQMLGQCWYALSGYRTTRWAFIVTQDGTNLHDITDTLTANSIEITPRTRHLLGVT